MVIDTGSSKPLESALALEGRPKLFRRPILFGVFRSLPVALLGT